MYGNTSDSTHYLTRTGSHATKGSRTGQVDAPWAATEALYSDLKEGPNTALDALARLKAEAEDINDRLPGTSGDYRKTLQARRRELGTLTQQQQETVGDLKDKVRAAAHQSWAECFAEQARLILSDESFHAVVAATREALGRPHQEIKMRHGSFVGNSAEAKAHVRKKEKIRAKRKKFRRKRSPSPIGRGG